VKLKSLGEWIADIQQEAAALYTLTNLSPSTLKPGRRFVVCDAGGGTVDLISYEVTEVDRLTVKEVTEGTGGRCGSAMLNQRFRRHLKQTHGDRYWTDDRLVLAINEFESVSVNAFDGVACQC
jgi:serine/threonine-protein kinase ATR